MTSVLERENTLYFKWRRGQLLIIFGGAEDASQMFMMVGGEKKKTKLVRIKMMLGSHDFNVHIQSHVNMNTIENIHLPNW